MCAVFVSKERREDVVPESNGVCLSLWHSLFTHNTSSLTIAIDSRPSTGGTTSQKKCSNTASLSSTRRTRVTKKLFLAVATGLGAC